MNISRLTLTCVLALLSACGDEPGDSTTDTSSGTTSASTGSTGDSTGGTAEPSTGDSTGPTTGEGSTGASTTGGGVADCGFDPALMFSRTGLIFQLQSTDGASCVWLERRDDSEPDVIYKAVPYTLLELKAGHDGAVAHVTDPARLTWESTHHNWTDVATAEADAVRYRLEDWYTSDQGGEAFTDKWALFARDAATDVVLWGPVLLYPYPGSK